MTPPKPRIVPLLGRDLDLGLGLGLGVVLLGLFAVACGGRTPWYVGVDASTGSDAASHPDAGPPADAHVDPDGGPTCEEGEYWELVATPVQEVYVMSPHGYMTDGMPEGISVRVHVGVPVGGCDRLAGVGVSLDWQYLMVNLESYVWAYRGPDTCPMDLRVEPENWALPGLSVGDWTLWDAFSMDGPSALTHFMVRECMDGEDCQCTLWDGIPGSHGASCRYDCQCEWPLACVYEGMMDPEWGGSCTQTCSTDSDCPLPMMCVYDWEDVPEGYCAMERERCTSNAQCAEGFECLPNPQDTSRYYCQPMMEVIWDMVRCEDDCDCAVGYACLSTTDTMTRLCQIPCRGNGDCPSELMCDDQGSYWQNTRVCSGWWD